MTATTLLTVAQLLVLTTAAQRPDHMILPLPLTLKVRGATQQRLLASLLRAILVEELPVTDDALAWRHDESGERFGLRLTPDGLAAIRSNDDSQAEPSTLPTPAVPATVETTSSSCADASVPEVTRPSQPNGKLGTVLQAVSAEAGATLAELVALTGWLPHTTRAALTALRKRGFVVGLEEQQGRKAYRLTQAG
jgi:hypothetical protein